MDSFVHIYCPLIISAATTIVIKLTPDEIIVMMFHVSLILISILLVIQIAKIWTRNLDQF